MRRLLALCAALLLACCGQDGTVQGGGGATETGNGLRFNVVSAESRPAAFATIQLVRTDTWIQDLAALGAPRVVTVQTDIAGSAFIDRLPAGKWAVQGDWGSQSAITAIGSDTGTVILKLQPVSWVRQHLSGAKVRSLHVVGSAWNSPVDSQGNADLYLPAGRFAMSARVDTSAVVAGTVSVTAWAPSSGSAVIDPKRVVLDDFTSGGQKTTFWSYSGFGNWYSVSHKNTKIWSATDSVGPSYNGYLSMQYSNGDTIMGYATSGISFVMGGVYHSLNLTKMDSLCFDMRGSGRLTVLYQKITGQAGNPLVSTELNLLPSWTHQCLTPSSFGGGWDSLKTRGNDLGFMGTKGSLVEVRSLVVWGVPLQALIR